MHPTSHSSLHFANDTPNHFDPPVTRAKLGSLGNQIRNRETRGRLVMADSTRTRSDFKCLGARLLLLWWNSICSILSAEYIHDRVCNIYMRARTYVRTQTFHQASRPCKSLFTRDAIEKRLAASNLASTRSQPIYRWLVARGRQLWASRTLVSRENFAVMADRVCWKGSHIDRQYYYYWTLMHV